MSHLIRVIWRIPFTYCDGRIHPLYITLLYENLSRTQRDENKATLQLGRKYSQYLYANALVLLFEASDIVRSKLA